MAVDELLASLVDRIRAFEDGDPGPVMAPQALEEAAELFVEASADGSTPVEIVRVMAWISWCRYRTRPADGQGDLDMALGLFGMVLPVDPDGVPSAVRDHLTRGQFTPLKRPPGA